MSITQLPFDTTWGDVVFIKQYRYKGVIKGTSKKKKVYGDHLVDLTVEIHNYEKLIQTELNRLKNLKEWEIEEIQKLFNQNQYSCWDGRGRHAVERSINLNDIFTALDSLLSKREGSKNNQFLKQNDMETLAPGFKRNKKTGVVYFAGVVIFENIIEQARYPSPEIRSCGKVVAQRTIAKFLNLQSRNWRIIRLDNIDPDNIRIGSVPF